MTEDRGVLREVAWQEVFPWSLLFSAGKLALNMRVLLLGALGLFIASTGWMVIDKLFGVEPNASLAQINIVEQMPGVGLNQSAFAPGYWPPAQPQAWLQGPLGQAWAELSLPFTAIFSREISFARFCYLLLCGLWSLAVWAFIGGAITRYAAIELTRQEKLSWGSLLGYARTKWPSYFAAPLFPLLGVFVAAVPLAILGLILRAGGFGVAFVALLWPLVLLAGVVMAILAVGLWFAFPLMWATISTEGTDSFDALSRSYAYTLQRPLRYLLYVLLATLIGLITWVFVVIFANAVVQLGLWGVSWGSGSERLGLILASDDSTGAFGFGSWLIGLWNRVVTLIANGFIYSYFWVAATAIYLLLRFHVDATELDEVYLPDETDPHGLPPLTTDEAGVPQAADLGGGSGNSVNVSPEG